MESWGLITLERVPLRSGRSGRAAAAARTRELSRPLAPAAPTAGAVRAEPRPPTRYSLSSGAVGRLMLRAMAQKRRPVVVPAVSKTRMGSMISIPASAQ